MASSPTSSRSSSAPGWEVVVQSGAGRRGGLLRRRLRRARVPPSPPDAAELAAEGAGLVVGVNAPDGRRGGRPVPTGSPWSELLPAGRPVARRCAALAGRGVTVFSFDLLPRISRAQGMDALSSQSTVSGYRAGLTAAEHLAKFFPMFMTAAGTVPPAKVLVMGVGVAGLQAIATARRLGARGQGLRRARRGQGRGREPRGHLRRTRRQSPRGSGGYARELSEDELDRQRAALASEVAASDVVITTAAVPGRAAPDPGHRRDGRGDGARAPSWWTWRRTPAATARLTGAGEVVEHHGVHIVGMANPPSGMPTHASFLYARNVANVLALMGHDGSWRPIGTTRSSRACACCARAGDVVRGADSGARRFGRGEARDRLRTAGGPVVDRHRHRRVPDRLRAGRVRRGSRSSPRSRASSTRR